MFVNTTEPLIHLQQENLGIVFQTQNFLGLFRLGVKQEKGKSVSKRSVKPICRVPSLEKVEYDSHGNFVALAMDKLFFLYVGRDESC